MIKLTDWYITKHIAEEDKSIFYLAWGYVSGHPRLDDGEHIHTSGIDSVNYDSKNNKLVMITYSGNKYELPLVDININRYEEIEGYLKRFNIFIPSFEECKNLVTESDNELAFQLDKVLQDGELYLRMSGSKVIKAYWRNKDIRPIKVSTHTGMFQDSYLVTDWERHEVDFRYFDGFLIVEPYHYSDGLKAILIDNIGSTSIKFKDDNFSKICGVGEVTRIECKHFNSEGLVSPDVVNGKNVLSTKYRG